MDATPPENEHNYDVWHDPADGALLVAASGELDLAAAPRLATVLSMATSSSEPAVVLDLSEVDFVDSTALGAIMHASTEAEPRATTCWYSRLMAPCDACSRSPT